MWTNRHRTFHCERAAAACSRDEDVHLALARAYRQDTHELNDEQHDERRLNP